MNVIYIITIVLSTQITVLCASVMNESLYTTIPTVCLVIIHRNWFCILYVSNMDTL